jgi:hypothetical protein
MSQSYEAGAFAGGAFFGALAMFGLAALLMDGPKEIDRKHELFQPFCVKERSALECEALWQGIEVKP